MKRLKVGDVLSIETQKGLVMLHYVFDDKNFGQLIRVMPDFFDETPQNPCEWANVQERYMIFFPLKAAYRQLIVGLVGHCPAEKFSKPPFMRSDLQIFPNSDKKWSIVNTDNCDRTFVKQLTSEQLLLSPFGIWNDTLLIERLEEDWKLSEWK